MKRVLIVGATSTIAIACARLWAEQGATLFLVARNAEHLKQTADDLSARGAAAVSSFTMDVLDFNTHAGMVSSCIDALHQIDVALIAHGTLPDQAACEQDADLALREFSCNGSSNIALMTHIAIQLEKQRCGTLAIISSVAGDRGRPSNYVYGSAKAAVSTFAAGLRARLFKVGASVVTIKPGFVNTRMTRDLDLPAPLVAEPEAVARAILRGIERKRSTLYVPGFWRWVMLIIRSIPEPIFKRLKL